MLASVAAMCIGVSASSLTAEPLKRFEYSQVHMGGEVKLSLYAAHEETAEAAAKAAFAEFARIEQVASDYRASSDLMKFNAEASKGWAGIDFELFTIFLLAFPVMKASGGAFDITAGPVVKLWREARQTGKMPDVRSALELVGYKKLEINVHRESGRFAKPGMQIDLGGIAKGYACDAAISAISRQGVFRSLVQAGGDMVASGPPPGERGWAVSVHNLPGQVFHLAYGAMSTSGDASQYVEIDGKRYSHIVDPRTGMGVTNRIQATVFADRGGESDPIATALCVGGRDLIEPLRAVGLKDAILIYGD